MGILRDLGALGASPRWCSLTTALSSGTGKIQEFPFPGIFHPKIRGFPAGFDSSCRNPITKNPGIPFSRDFPPPKSRILRQIFSHPVGIWGIVGIVGMLGAARGNRSFGREKIPGFLLVFLGRGSGAGGAAAATPEQPRGGWGVGLGSLLCGS